MSDKGKRRASDVESEPEDETSQAQRQLSSHSEESGDEGGEEVTMHTQSIEAKRAVSQKLRKAALDVDRTRANLADTSVAALREQIARSEELFKSVKAPAEACLEASNLKILAESGSAKARDLKLDATAFDCGEFLFKVKKLLRVGMNDRAGEEEEDDEMDAEGGRGDNWDSIGQLLGKSSRKVPSIDFMFGPLTIAVKEKRVIKRRAKEVINEKNRQRAQSLDLDDIKVDGEEATKMVTMIRKVLKAHSPIDADTVPIPLFRFLINPHSFAESVENFFYFSFLVREGAVTIEIEEDKSSPDYGDAVIFVVDDNTSAEGVVQSQLVLVLDQEIWKNAIEAYEITESLIPDRRPKKGQSPQKKKAW